MKKRVAVLVFPGTNCDYDTKYAYEELGAEAVFVWHKEDKLPANIDLVVVPGGFSYGDYLRSGAIARFAPIMQAVKRYADEGGRVLGICNGFQILTEAHLLPGALKRNRDLHFISRFQKLTVVSNDNTFLKGYSKGTIIDIPIAHADGSYYVDDKTLATLEANGQILLRYCNDHGDIENPNGSVGAIAGICNSTKNVFGLMPHPERAVDELLGSTDGRRMLANLLEL
ncbi:MAG: phosphoribosylformylglycinamidine synthase subunit PurQ [Campylobacterales bacterium]